MRCVWFHVIYYVFYSKFYWSVFYTAFDPIIFVQVTRFCLLSYSFMYCILHFLFYFSCLYSVLFVIFCFVCLLSWSWHDHDYRHKYCRDNVSRHNHAQCHIINFNSILHRFCFKFYFRVCSRLLCSTCSVFYSIFCFIL